MKNLVINPVKVSTSRLKVGQLYVDGVKDDESKMCIFEFVEHDEEGDPYFKYINGHNPYSSSSKGLFGFTRSGDDWSKIESFEEQD